MTITEEIIAIETYVSDCFTRDLPIDTKKMKRLYDLRIQRIQELADQHRGILSLREKRLEIMQAKTREWIKKKSTAPIRGKPDLVDRIISEEEKYDAACICWVNEESCPWEESSASSIATGILILIHEIS